jgi:hypothetical protein
MHSFPQMMPLSFGSVLANIQQILVLCMGYESVFVWVGGCVWVCVCVCACVCVCVCDLKLHYTLLH